MKVFGIDPGQKGAVAELSSNGVIEFMSPLAVTREKKLDSGAFARLIEDRMSGDVRVFVEEPQVFAMNGKSAMTFGRMIGALESILAQYFVRFEFVKPTAWTKELHEGLDRKYSAKARSEIAAGRLFPKQDFLIEGSRSKKPHDGLIDAVLIAEYGRRKLGLK